MTEGKIQNLLNYLTSIGFEGSSLEQDIRKNIDSGSEQFDAKHEIVWEQEKMQFSLSLAKDLQFQGYRLTNYQATHIDEDGNVNSQTFTPTPHGICNTNLAYHIVSGRFDDLCEKVSILNLGDFPGVNPYRNLEIFLSKDANEFSLQCTRNEPEGYIEYKIPVSKINGWYALDVYLATLTPHPAITHGIFNGIDTKVLEDEMRKINWHNDDELFVLYDDSEPKVLPPAIDIVEKMLTLTDDPAGRLIADNLMLKYWSDSSYFESFIEQRAWDYVDSFPKREQYFPVDLEAKAAFNLLCGRAILQSRAYPAPCEKPGWVRFDLAAKSPDGGYLKQLIPDFDEVQLEAILDNLPIPPDIYSQITQELTRGDITCLTLPNGTNILLEANPEQKTVNIYTEDMRPIPMNLHFDPDWKAAQGPELNLEELKRKPRQNIIHAEYPPDKGHSLRRSR